MNRESLRRCFNSEPIFNLKAQKPAENSSATSLMNFPFSSQMPVHSHGLMCFTCERRLEETVIVICNPSTGQSLNLPNPRIKVPIFAVACFLAYEPIKKQFKALLSYARDGHQVLTLGTGDLSWRRIECSIPYYPTRMSEICINGFLYYPAVNVHSNDFIIICFDVSSEKFRFIKGMEAARKGTLINYNGKLASIIYKLPKSIKLWILQDAEKQVWSKHRYVVPTWFRGMVEDVEELRFLGVTHTNEIMLVQSYIAVPFYVFYFSIEKKAMRRVAMHGMEAFQYHEFLTFSDHVENVKLIDHMSLG